MTKFRLNPIFLFVLITAFLTMQWTSAHIHLAEHHDHDGDHHQHNIEVHAHHSIGHHADAIDFSHQTGDVSVVELDHDYSTPKVKKQDRPSAAIITTAFQPLSFSQAIRIEPPLVANTKLSHLYRSTVNPRAPPLFS